MLPTEFSKRMQSQLGDDFEAFFQSLHEPAPVSVRVNPRKRVHDFDGYEKVQWSTDSFYLPERISFTLDPLFHGGCYYVQEASSMIIGKVIKQITGNEEPVTVLDLCAAPGGKSTHILSTLPEGSLLVSNEMVAQRNIILQQNLTKWGYSNVVVTQNDAGDFKRLPGFFDVVIVDAPCSGEGLFRKQPDAMDEWSEDVVNVCVLRQTAILDAVYDSLKPGGHLVYSTCTYEENENELQCDRLMEHYGMRPVQIGTAGNGIVPVRNGWRFYPHLIKGEGFFISVLKKREDAEKSSIARHKSLRINSEDAFISTFIKDPFRFFAFRKNDELYALPKNQFQQTNLLMDRLFVRKAGIHVGTIKGRDLVPGHELALSVDLHPDVPRIALSAEESIQYLKCENINLKNIPQGWAAVTFRDFPLGWIKGIGHRINNYFPRNLKIRKS